VFYDSKLREKRPVGTDQDSRVLESLSLFKAGVEPSWEDAANIRGGEWWMRKAVTPAVLDNWWTNIVLGLVGCTIENSDDICGVRVVDKSKAGDGRTFVKIELWLRTKVSFYLFTSCVQNDFKQRRLARLFIIFERTRPHAMPCSKSSVLPWLTAILTKQMSLNANSSGKSMVSNQRPRGSKHLSTCVSVSSITGC